MPDAYVRTLIHCEEKPMNSFLSRLGYGPEDRVVVLHADDIGMCQATLPAYIDLLEFGLLSSAATMVPCPWFSQTAALCRAHPEADLGVHLTLTCEWDAYRWGPVSTRDPASGLLDAEGYLPRTSEAVWEHADEGAVRTEIEAQLDRALAAGVDVTHIDTHMGTLVHPRFAPGYVDLALSRRLPLLMMRLDPAKARNRDLVRMNPDAPQMSLKLAERLETVGLPVFDNVAMLPLDRPEERVDQARRVLDSLPPGLSLFIIHPAQDTSELRAIAPDWPSRVADYKAFTSPELRDYVHNAGIHVLGYRALRDIR